MPYSVYLVKSYQLSASAFEDYLCEYDNVLELANELTVNRMCYHFEFIPILDTSSLVIWIIIQNR
jgi:hypothetical protein